MKKRSTYGDLIICEIISQRNFFSDQFGHPPTGMICNMELFEFVIASQHVDWLYSWLKEIRFITLEDCDKLILKDEDGNFRVFPPPEKKEPVHRAVHPAAEK